MNKYLRNCPFSHEKSVRSRMISIGYAPKINSYIQELVGTVESIFGLNSIHSVILFGSIAHGHTARISDVDLLIIVNNTISRHQIKKIEVILDALEIKYEFGRYAEKWYSSILRVVEKTTGMFCSHFICRLEDWEKEDFAAIFSTNRPLTYLMAPNQIVLGSMKSSGKLLVGSAALEIKKQSYPRKQLIKSLFMNLSISLAALAIMPLNRSNMKYVLEAYKWSLQSAYFFLFSSSIPLKNIVRFYLRLGSSLSFNRLFLHYRRDLRVDCMFAVKSFFQIIKIYYITLQQNKVKKRFHRFWSIFGVS